MPTKRPAVVSMSDYDAAFEENIQLRARVTELEAKQRDYESAYPAAIGQMSRAETDLARKREECERLEEALGNARGLLAAAHEAMGEDRAEILRLRRELRGKR